MYIEKAEVILVSEILVRIWYKHKEPDQLKQL